MAMNLSRRILGVHETTPPAGTTSRYPTASWGREFVSKPGGGPLPETTTAAQLAALVLTKTRPHTDTGGGCLISLKLPMASVAINAWDGRLTALATALTGLNVIVILWHEPENDLTPQVFVPAHNRARTVLQTVNPDLPVATAAMAYQWRPGSKTTADARAWTADLQADLYLADVYSGNSFPATAILPEHPGWTRWHTEMIAPYPGRRWGIAERGITTGPTRPATIAREADWLATDPIGRTCSLYLWWATSGTEKNAGWLLGDTESQTALAALLTRIAAPTPGTRWRLGNHNPNNLYHDDTHVGMLIQPELAAQIVSTMNAADLHGNIGE